MFKLEQLQALDYLLKRIISDNSYALYEKNLKLVIDVNGTLWYGDFIQIDGISAYRPFIDDDGDIETDKFGPTRTNSALLKCIWDSYSLHADRQSPFWSNPFRKIDSLPFLFESLLKVLRLTEIPEDCSPFYPYLLNAKSVDGKMELPFINLEGEQIKLVSIIEID
ncbi:hypothetical protein [Paenibacillus dendritiformis]|uniref:hypothetical protein n=1 Tax=Paenibacillus dendritiformis TaxID=130049 RepID=UPI000DA7F6F8|nr:hypothetical protein [Paenibacillus dendritiformis]PZM62574.1 hypothetical protein DOE73_26315 [Paenibacillus dendritiformis]